LRSDAQTVLGGMALYDTFTLTKKYVVSPVRT